MADRDGHSGSAPVVAGVEANGRFDAVDGLAIVLVVVLLIWGVVCGLSMYL